MSHRLWCSMVYCVCVLLAGCADSSNPQASTSTATPVAIPKAVPTAAKDGGASARQALPAAAPSTSSCAQVHPVSHRGNTQQAQENTVRAVQDALSMGYTRVELDVRLLADGTAALHHDALIGRVVQGTGEQRVSALNLAQWQRLRVVHPDASTQAPNVLQDVLPVLQAHPSAQLLLEIKSTPSCTQIQPIVQSAVQALPGRVRFAAISVPVLQCIRSQTSAPVVMVFAPHVTDADVQRAQIAQSVFAKDMQRYGVSQEQARATLRRSYAQNGNWDYLSDPPQLLSVLQQLAPATVLIDAPMLTEHTGVWSELQRLGVGVATYSNMPHKHHAQYLHTYAASSGMWVQEWVLDGAPADACTLEQ